MKKRYLPPSPLKKARKNPLSKGKGEENGSDNGGGSNNVDNNSSSAGNNVNIKSNRKSRMYLMISAGVVIVLVVLVAVYIQKYSSFCFVWQEWAYPQYKNETECIYIRDNIRKSRPLSTAGFRYLYRQSNTSNIHLNRVRTFKI